MALRVTSDFEVDQNHQFMHTIHRIIFIIAVVWLAGCGSSPLSTFPNFSGYKPKMTACALLADCVIIDDMIGDTNRIDVVANKSLGGLLLTHFTHGLVGKGYHVDNA